MMADKGRRGRFSTKNDWGLHILLVAALALSLLARLYEPFPGDVPFLRWVRSWGHPLVADFMQAVSVLGKSILMVGLAGIVMLILYIRRQQAQFRAAAGVLIILFFTPILQWLVNRSRPSADIVGSDAHMRGLGFPSGHAFQSFVLFGFLVYLAAIRVKKTWLRRSIQALLVFLILSIGISRVYLGAHWPSDILGAYLLGSSLLALLYRRCPLQVPDVPVQ
jgi:undecaprenyl-diphosphatase